MAKREARVTESTGKRPIQDLREWLARVEEMGDLIRIKQPVSCDEEMSAIGYLVAKQTPSPAILFESVKGYEKSPFKARLLWNILGPSIPRIALTLEEPSDTPTLELIRRVKDKFRNRMAPREVSPAQAGFFANSVTADKIDLNQLPIPRHWPLDGGRYAGTADVVITRDPDNGYLNVGTYRMMLQGKKEVGLYLSPGKDARLHITRSWQMGKPVEVAAAWGIDPLFMLIGSQTFP
ncbi:MAG: UbiD family decarboxylase, partial [Candidatus Binatia bacterium]